MLKYWPPWRFLVPLLAGFLGFYVCTSGWIAMDFIFFLLDEVSIIIPASPFLSDDKDRLFSVFTEFAFAKKCVLFSI